ncbi:MAG: hypothetical protein HZB40_05150 [Rhodocyclales bacterium]|nr:hypothetical protein [Rhodocyclales bacterium]
MNTTNPASDIHSLRIELRRQLALQRRSSLYNVLGLAADCSDEAIAGAVAGLTANGAQPDAEARYAIEILGRPQAREAFDRQLLDQLRRPQPAPQILEPTARPTRSPWVLPVTVGILGLLVLGGAWLGLSAMKENAEREMRRLEVEAKAEEARRRAEAIPKASELMRQAAETAAAEQKQDAEFRERMVEESRAREERFREEREKAYQQELAREDKRRQEALKDADTRAARDMMNSLGSSAAQKAAGR